MKFCELFNRFYFYHDCFFDQQIDTERCIDDQAIVLDCHGYLRGNKKAFAR